MKRISLLLLTSLLFLSLKIDTVFAEEEDFTYDPYHTSEVDPFDYLEGGTPATLEEMSPLRPIPMPRASQDKGYNIPGNQGKLTSNVWRSQVGQTSGNTLQWDYQVSAVYSGSKKVESIRTTWKASASMRNSANISLGISGSGVNTGGGSAWTTTSTKTKYWENSSGAKESSYRSNVIISPKGDYRTGTISVTNTAKVKLSGDKKSYEISAGA
ncbi:hypothetical protein [Peribacillus muralis]|uniref:hypothetical protein n=1 Tax=Peribacillus muralis TaxID=264697 RepID=UPI00070FE4CE|nr:hypothetical protein [Peribacillus muralis]